MASRATHPDAGTRLRATPATEVRLTSDVRPGPVGTSVTVPSHEGTARIDVREIARLLRILQGATAIRPAFPATDGGHPRRHLRYGIHNDFPQIH
jgi:hypothetical protein